MVTLLKAWSTPCLPPGPLARPRIPCRQTALYTQNVTVRLTRREGEPTGQSKVTQDSGQGCTDQGDWGSGVGRWWPGTSVLYRQRAGPPNREVPGKPHPGLRAAHVAGRRECWAHRVQKAQCWVGNGDLQSSRPLPVPPCPKGRQDFPGKSGRRGNRPWYKREVLLCVCPSRAEKRGRVREDASGIFDGLCLQQTGLQPLPKYLS